MAETDAAATAAGAAPEEAPEQGSARPSPAAARRWRGATVAATVAAGALTVASGRAVCGAAAAAVAAAARRALPVLPPEGACHQRGDRQRACREEWRATQRRHRRLGWRRRGRRRRGLGFRRDRIGVEPLAQLARERAGRAEALLGILGHRPRHDVGERLRHGLVDLAGERRFVREHGVGDFLQGLALERLDVGQQLVENDAEREHVGAAIGGLALHLLGSHVVGRAGAGHGVAAFVAMGDAGDAEIEHARLRAADHEDVGRLDVAMDHALRMGKGQRVGDPAHDQRRLRRRGAPAFAAQLAQVAALQQLHRDVGAVVADAGVEHGDDVRVAQPAGGARLVDEERVEGLALFLVDLDVERLDGDQPRQQRVVRREHRAEAAAAELVLERIAADVADRRHRLIGRRRHQAREAGDRWRGCRCRSRSTGRRLAGSAVAGSESPGTAGGGELLLFTAPA